MKIMERKIDGVMVVKLVGRFDADAAPAVDKRLHDLVAAGETRLVLDLSEAPFLATAGIRVMQRMLRETRPRSGDLRLGGAQPLVMRSLALVGLAPMLKTYADAMMAAGSF